MNFLKVFLGFLVILQHLTKFLKISTTHISLLKAFQGGHMSVKDEQEMSLKWKQTRSKKLKGFLVYYILFLAIRAFLVFSREMKSARKGPPYMRIATKIGTNIANCSFCQSFICNFEEIVPGSFILVKILVLLSRSSY